MKRIANFGCGLVLFIFLCPLAFWFWGTAILPKAQGDVDVALSVFLLPALAFLALQVAQTVASLFFPLPPKTADDWPLSGDEHEAIREEIKEEQKRWRWEEEQERRRKDGY